VQLFKPREDSPFSQRDNACWVATFGTAWYALEQANLTSPSSILVHSASGGVGSMLVQIAKARGHTVVGVVGRSEKVDYCRSIGADAVIDKSTMPLWETAIKHAASYREFRGFHAVFDANGVATLKDSYRNTLPGGRLVVYGFHSMLPKKGGFLGFFQWVSLRQRWHVSAGIAPFTDHYSCVVASCSRSSLRGSGFDRPRSIPWSSSPPTKQSLASTLVTSSIQWSYCSAASPKGNNSLLPVLSSHLM